MGEAPRGVLLGRGWKRKGSVQANTAGESQLDRVPDRFSGQRVDPLSDKKAAQRPLRSSLAGGQAGRTMFSSLLYLIISSYLLETRDAFSPVARVQEEAAAWWDSVFPISFFTVFHRLSQLPTSGDHIWLSQNCWTGTQPSSLIPAPRSRWPAGGPLLDSHPFLHLYPSISIWGLKWGISSNMPAGWSASCLCLYTNHSSVYFN